MTDDVSLLKKVPVLDTPSVKEGEAPRAHPHVLYVANRSQSMTPWGSGFRQRDQELRDFWHTEPWLASVVYSVSIRNASFAWEIIGSNPEKKPPRNTIDAVTRMLKRSDWRKLMIKSCIDLYSQDNGVFWYLSRTGRNQNAPIYGVVHLDSARCLRTGDPRYPVIYTDRKGREHVLRYWEVRTIEEFPSPIEEAFSTQYCAVSRCLLAAEIIQSIAVYKYEKIGGMNTRAIEVISGITKDNIDDAIVLATEQNLNRGLYRFSLPLVIPAIDPTVNLSHVHIDLASLPDNFSEDESFKWYVAQLAAAFGVDYQEIAPLMTGNLGSSQQSEIMHLKTRGKGPALIMGRIEDTLNGVLPGNVEFRFKEQDLRAESEKAEARFTRAKDRAMRVKSGELDVTASRELAVQDGDLPAHMAKELDRRQPDEVEPDREFGADQITAGTGSQEERALIDYDTIRKMISEQPDAFVRNRYV